MFSSLNKQCRHWLFWLRDEASGWQYIVKMWLRSSQSKSFRNASASEWKKTSRNLNLWSGVLTALLTSPTQVLYNSKVGCLSNACQVLDFLSGFPVGLYATSNKHASTVKSHVKPLNSDISKVMGNIKHKGSSFPQFLLLPPSKKTTTLVWVISQFNVEKRTKEIFLLPKAAGISKSCGTKTLYARGAC